MNLVYFNEETGDLLHVPFYRVAHYLYGENRVEWSKDRKSLLLKWTKHGPDGEPWDDERAFAYFCGERG